LKIFFQTVATINYLIIYQFFSFIDEMENRKIILEDLLSHNI